MVVHTRTIRSDNTSGYRGVRWAKANKKWAATININNKRLNLGFYETKEDAAIAYENELMKHFTEDDLKKQTIKEEKAWRKKHYRKNKKTHLLKSKLRSQQLKADIVKHYGGACRCCGENRIEFLTIDHIAQDGSTHVNNRGRRLNGDSLYRWLVRMGYPMDNFRLLCMNCNFSFGMYGYCPHEKKAMKREI